MTVVMIVNCGLKPLTFNTKAWPRLGFSFLVFAKNKEPIHPISFANRNQGANHCLRSKLTWPIVGDGKGGGEAKGSGGGGGGGGCDSGSWRGAISTCTCKTWLSMLTNATSVKFTGWPLSCGDTSNCASVAGPLSAGMLTEKATTAPLNTLLLAEEIKGGGELCVDRERDERGMPGQDMRMAVDIWYGPCIHELNVGLKPSSHLPCSSTTVN